MSQTTSPRIIKFNSKEQSKFKPLVTRLTVTASIIHK